jgi:IclR family mhp operon transcriptional activator
MTPFDAELLGDTIQDNECRRSDDCCVDSAANERPASNASGNSIKSVSRAFTLLELMNRRAWSTVGQLHQDTGLPKPTVVRMLATLMQAGYVTKDSRQNGYCVTMRVQSLSCGFHGDPLVVEAARPWAIALTRELHWPVGVAMLDGDSVVIRFSTISDSSISPFHATLNMRLSLFSNGLGLAYYAFCPESERETLRAMIGEGESDLLTTREQGWLDWRVERARKQGYATRDPITEPCNSGTIAVPIFVGDRVAATIGITYFRRAVAEPDMDHYASALRRTARAIGAQITSLEEFGDA